MKLDKLKGPEIETQYKNLSFLDSGGMADIYIADDTVNNQKVAIKIIRITNDDTKALFEEEFKIAISLSHENIVKTYYYGEAADSTGNYFYSVSEFCSTGNLRKKIAAKQIFTISESVNYFYDLLNGIQEAHKYCIHRDLKPENILVADNGKLKICDFGIAKYIDHLTRTKTFKGYGTYPYMSPECWINDANTKQMDIYSLGIIFFEILTFQKPFNGPTEREFMHQHLFQTLPAIPSIRSDFPIMASEIIMKMTNKNINERYKEINEVICDFDKAFEPTISPSFNIQPILKKVHIKINAQMEAELIEKRKREEFANQQQILNYSIGQLFNQFSRVCGSINSQTIEEKVKHTPFIVTTNAVASCFKLSFLFNSLTISFYKGEIIKEYIVRRKQSIIDLQKKNYGFIVSEIAPEFIEKDKAIILSKIETSTQCNGSKIGFNLILKKSHIDDIYGEWWICKFSPSPLYSYMMNHCYFALEPGDFFKYFEFCRGNVQCKIIMDYHKIMDSDIVELIETMIS